jgi:coproporphyrinogen III oxidase-like Fe-S oxidoreductase
VGGLRWRNRPGQRAYLAALAHRDRPPREVEPLGEEVQRRERLMLGLRLDEPLALAEVEGVVDPAAAQRLEGLGLLEQRDGRIALTGRGRLVGGGVTAELLV